MSRLEESGEWRKGGPESLERYAGGSQSKGRERHSGHGMGKGVSSSKLAHSAASWPCSPLSKLIAASPRPANARADRVRQ